MCRAARNLRGEVMMGLRHMACECKEHVQAGTLKTCQCSMQIPEDQAGDEFNTEAWKEQQLKFRAAQAGIFRTQSHVDSWPGADSAAVANVLKTATLLCLYKRELSFIHVYISNDRKNAM
jgi:hypothetical protein